MTEHAGPSLVPEIRSALAIAAMRHSLVTYAELGKAVGGGRSVSKGDLRSALHAMADADDAEGEPSLAALVVDTTTGDPDPRFESAGKRWSLDVHDVFRRWG